MPNYRRNRTPGGTYFFTINLANRNSDLLTREIEALRTAIRTTRHRAPFHIDAWVILPDHMHCLWTLPEGDTDYAARWRALKTRFTKATTQNFAPSPWQNRYWEHTIRTENDYRAHMDYIHFNPVKHGLAPHPAAWPFSTFQKCVAQGLYDPTWSSPDTPDPHPEMGEPDHQPQQP
ncbi:MULTISPECIES: REP-associated tyrosine transposase [Acidiphilium]|uniref:Putative transposase n=1 Tax=Acidiphilium rubrum TaxID=526 RepID=A0A8G2FH99_ACIRU|nr:MULTISPECIES: transposase [Acidiphilium]SIR12630.1 putative transposase [Acidiphilium rubrum]